MYDRLVRFLLLCEGRSDTALVPHLRRLLSRCGVPEVVGSAVALASVRDPGAGRGSLERKIRAVLSTETELELIFAHRDADAAGFERRLEGIACAFRNSGLDVAHVPIIPVKSTDAWILLDEGAIRRVAGNPRGKQTLLLPGPSRIEHLHDPKETLKAALVAACGHQGHRLRKFRSRFGQHRRILLEQLPVGGALDDVPAWVRLERSVLDFVSRPNNDLSPTPGR